MPSICHDRHIRESLRGSGPCQISWEVRKRSGRPNWWCHTHGMEASAPDGLALETCPGGWLDPVPAELQLDLDLADGEVAIWGALPPAIECGEPPHEVGKVHVHRRPIGSSSKDFDQSYDIVRVSNGSLTLVIEGMAAVAFSISDLSGRSTRVLACPRCGGRHIDELKFATWPHKKHVCNSCGRDFWDVTGPSIGNPLSEAHVELGVTKSPPSINIDRQISIRSADFSGIMIWPSNRAILSTMSRPEELGIHVHAWAPDGSMQIDETYYPVILDGRELDLADLRFLAVQRALSKDELIKARLCVHCGAPLLSPQQGWVEPVTSHPCNVCGHITETPRKLLLNPLADNWRAA